MDFKGKVVLITGASSGIGAGTAEYFASLGASLAITGRKVENLRKTEEACTKISKTNNRPLSIVADLLKETDIKPIVEKTIARYGRLDVLINNAGILYVEPIQDINIDHHDEIMTTNTRAVVILTKLCLPHLIESKGNIINISSVAGLRPFANFVSYCMSKAALDQFTKCVALDVASKKVRVNAVNPGAVISDIQVRGGLSTKENLNDFIAQMEKSHPIGYVPEARDIATVIAFLASDLAANVTGVTMPVDGGFSINGPSG